MIPFSGCTWTDENKSESFLIKWCSFWRFWLSVRTCRCEENYTYCSDSFLAVLAHQYWFMAVYVINEIKSLKLHSCYSDQRHLSFSFQGIWDILTAFGEMLQWMGNLSHGLHQFLFRTGLSNDYLLILLSVMSFCPQWNFGTWLCPDRTASRSWPKFMQANCRRWLEKLLLDGRKCKLTNRNLICFERNIGYMLYLYLANRRAFFAFTVSGQVR